MNMTSKMFSTTPSCKSSSKLYPLTKKIYSKTTLNKPALQINLQTVINSCKFTGKVKNSVPPTSTRNCSHSIEAYDINK